MAKPLCLLPWAWARWVNKLPWPELAVALNSSACKVMKKEPVVAFGLQLGCRVDGIMQVGYFTQELQEQSYRSCHIVTLWEMPSPHGRVCGDILTPFLDGRTCGTLSTHCKHLSGRSFLLRKERYWEKTGIAEVEKGCTLFSKSNLKARSKCIGNFLISQILGGHIPAGCQVM